MGHNHICQYVRIKRNIHVEVKSIYYLALLLSLPNNISLLSLDGVITFGCSVS